MVVKYETFEEYCLHSLDMSRSHAYNLINSTEVFDELSANADIKVKPKNEFQVRSLIALPKEKRVVAWKKVESAGQPVTAKLVGHIAAEFKPKPVGKPAKVAKVSPVPVLNLQPAYELIGEIEGMAVAAKNRRLLAKVAELRKFFQRLGGK